MRTLAAVFVCLMMLSLRIAQKPKNALPASLGPAPVVELVARGCSPGWQRGYWRDPAGARHWDRCLPGWR